MKFLIDMNLSPTWVPVLESADHSAKHWSQVGIHDAPDTDIVEYAQKNDYIILTHDLDFGIMLAIGGLSTPSVIQLRTQAVLPEDMESQLLRTIEVAAEYLFEGALVTISENKNRITLLPITRSSAP